MARGGIAVAGGDVAVAGEDNARGGDVAVAGGGAAVAGGGAAACPGSKATATTAADKPQTAVPNKDPEAYIKKLQTFQFFLQPDSCDIHSWMHLEDRAKSCCIESVFEQVLHAPSSITSHFLTPFPVFV